MTEAYLCTQLTLGGAHAQRGLRYLVRECVCVCVCPFVCYHVFSDYAQRHNETAIPTGSSLNWLHFKKGDFRITTAFRSHGVKSQYANEYHGAIAATFSTVFRRQRHLRVF